MQTTNGVTVQIRREGEAWVLLGGYAGGIALGMTSETLTREGDDDGITRVFKGNSSGSASQITVRLIEDDPGQVLLRQLAAADDDGLGGVRVNYPQGISVIADGLFHGLVENIVDPDNFQGFAVSFTQNEPETRT